eukprot:scaffold154992_cov30-Tisochrysis_lutea.AAC.2
MKCREVGGGGPISEECEHTYLALRQPAAIHRPPSAIHLMAQLGEKVWDGNDAGLRRQAGE